MQKYPLRFSQYHPSLFLLFSFVLNRISPRGCPLLTLGASLAPVTGLEAGWASTEQSQGLRVSPSSGQRPIWPPIFYGTVQYCTVHYSTGTHHHIFLSITGGFIQLFNKITNGKLVITSLVITLGSNESGDYNGSKTRKAREVHFFLNLTFCSIKHRTEPILSLMSWSLVTDD